MGYLFHRIRIDQVNLTKIAKLSAKSIEFYAKRYGWKIVKIASKCWIWIWNSKSLQKWLKIDVSRLGKIFFENQFYFSSHAK